MAPRKRRPPNKKKSNPFQSVGAQLALFRAAAGYTQAQLAPMVIISQAKLESIEQGRRPLTLSLAQEFDRILDTKGALEVAVSYLPEPDVIPVWAVEFVEFEREAIAISSFQNQVAPGMLQSESYMRAVFHNDIPTLSDEEIEFRVSARLERQEILQRKVPPITSFILSEAIVRDRIGGDEVYRSQLRHLRRMAEVPGIAIQILPLGRTAHAALDGPFVLLETPENDHLAYAETQRGSQLIYAPNDVSILRHKYAMLRTQALNHEETGDLLDRLLGE
ncbi:helix-turn-helix transcriptional regulator [Streptomyces sp. HPF1205]|uniref:helix-turn-helix domain-containing protein n=1 Tax=Streptomyces sp. HPF1205 TaxID=2873262 RepID=UPI001CEDC546|nr:helix-turn-helix transcriptional regulator [Streptomyces sp. HPF1205]